jgi:hypothetical protein
MASLPHGRRRKLGVNFGMGLPAGRARPVGHALLKLSFVGVVASAVTALFHLRKPASGRHGKNVPRQGDIPVDSRERAARTASQPTDADSRPEPRIISRRKAGPLRDFDPCLSAIAKEAIPDVDEAVRDVALPAVLE